MSVNGQELSGPIRTLRSRDDNNCIVVGTLEGVEIRMDVKELNKIITLLDFDLEKKRVHTYATLNEDSVASVYNGLEVLGNM